MDLVKTIKGWLQKKNKIKIPQQSGNNTEALKGLLHLLELTEENEVSCDEVYRLLDQYVEMANTGEDMQALMPMIKRHLEICQDCFEEYEALLRILNTAAS